MYRAGDQTTVPYLGRSSQTKLGSCAQRLAMMALGLAVLGLGGCEESNAENERASAAATASQGTAGTGEGSEDLEGYSVEHDLLQRAHLADYDRGGLLIDFGTPAANKYMSGAWKTGWGKQGRESSTSFRYVGDSARLYFPVEKQQALRLRFRLRPHGTRNLTLYVNNHAQQLVRLGEEAEFAIYEAKIAKEHVEQGENYVLMRFGGTSDIGGEKVSVAMDALHVVPEQMASSEQSAKPEELAARYEVRKAKASGKARQAVVLPGASSWSHFVQLPSKAKLVFSAASEKGDATPVKVFAQGDQGSEKELWSEEVGSSWERHVVSLADLGDEVARVRFEVGGKPSARVAFAAPAVMAPEPETKPRIEPAKNVVLLLIDTLRADKLKPFNPGTRVKTPVVDELAEQGVVAELAQSPENWTKPAVASVLTSLYPMTHGTKRDDSKLPQKALMLSEHLKASGFRTGSFIANGYVSDRFGFDQGWDHYTNYIRESKSTEAENVFGEAGDWIEKNKDKRFFAYVQTIDPHVPYDPPDEFLKMYDARGDYNGQVKPRMTPTLLEQAKKKDPEVRFDASDQRRLEALHDGEISYHDEQLGKFIQRLEKLGVMEDTLFVITSDHGEEFNDHGSWGHGHSVYQELLHVPLLFRYPKSLPGGARIESVVSTLDVAPTVLELTGVKPMADAEGHSLVPLIHGGSYGGPSVAFSDFLDDRRVVTTNRWKLILRGVNPTFFDLKKDPAEEHELPLNRHPIPMRYARVMLGQFLGASDRSKWLEARAQRSRDLREEKAQMDDTIKKQLKALGYAH